MAFDIKKLSPIGGQAKRGNAPQLYSYEAGADDISATGYLNSVYSMFSVGDVIMISNVTDSEITFYGVSASGSTGVTLVKLAFPA